MNIETKGIPMTSKNEGYRSLQLTGKSTYIVSLPKSWVKRIGLKKGDKVFLKELADSTLIIKPVKKEIVENRLEKTIGPKSTLNKVVRETVAAYLNGSIKIKVKLNRELLKHSYDLKMFIKDKLLGFEVIEETADKLILQSLVKSYELPLKKVLERMWITTYYMVEDALNSLINQDYELAENIVERDDEIDRFYFYANRQLKHAIKNPEILDDIGVMYHEDLIEYKSIIKTIERIADHATRIAKMVKRLKRKLPESIIKDLDRLKSESLTLLEYSMKSLYNNDKELAHEVLDSLEKVQQLEENLTKKYILGKGAGEHLNPLEIMSLKLILDSLRRIAEYSSDISESVLNLIMH